MTSYKRKKMVGCSAAGCTNSSKKGYTMVRFPKDPVLCKQWAENCGRAGWNPSQHCRLCDAHFEPHHWLKYKCRLKADATPQNFCYCPCGSAMKLRVPLPYNDHTYAAKSQHLEGCFKLTSRKTLQQPPNEVDLVEHCTLKRKLQDLTSKLAAKENSLQSTLAACSVLEKAAADSKPRTFDSDATRRGLQLRFACGTSRYEKVIKSPDMPKQPSVRTLQRKTEHITFEPGVQDDIISAPREKVKTLSDPRDRDCCLFFDAMATNARLDYDIGSKSFLGRSTLPGLKDPQIACKGEMWMFGGIRAKWKQMVAWHLTPLSECPAQKKNVVLELLKKADETGLNVVAVVCDMGNRGLLSELGFSTTKGNMKFCIPNPVKPAVLLYLVPDVVHVFKSLKEMICSNEILVLSDDIVKECMLPSNEVCLSHIEWLEEYQRGEDLKFFSKLQTTDIHTPHYSKMKVKSSYQVSHHKTSSAMSYLVEKKIVPDFFKTTAWFVQLMDRWRQLMTSRSPVTALGKKNPDEYRKARIHLYLVVRIFKSMRVKGGWKPVQTHLIIATEAILKISDFLLETCQYEFVLTGRFLQDIVENLFSVVRMQRPLPGPVELKYRLKQCAISQFNQEIKNSSYDFADVDDFVDLLLVKMREESPRLKKAELNITEFLWVASVPLGAFSLGQEDILYRMCGAVIVSLIKQNIVKCHGCIQKLKNNSTTPHPDSLLLNITNYKENAQFEVSDELYQMLRLVEYNLRKWKEALSKSTDCLASLVTGRIIPSMSNYRLSTCHDIKDKILNKFSWMRLKQLSQTISDALVNPKVVTSQFYSKTAGSNFLAENFSGKSKRSANNLKAKTLSSASKKNLKTLCKLP